MNWEKSLKKVVSKYTRMTGNKCLLDTSVIIHAFKKNNAVAAQLDAIGEIYVR